jgi:hypothetical protein
LTFGRYLELVNSLNKSLFLALSVTVGVVLYATHIFVCDSIFRDSGLCTPTFFPAIIISVVLVVMAFYTIVTLIKNIQIGRFQFSLNKLWVIGGGILHLVSLASMQYVLFSTKICYKAVVL